MNLLLPRKSSIIAVVTNKNLRPERVLPIFERIWPILAGFGRAWGGKFEELELRTSRLARAVLGTQNKNAQASLVHLKHCS